MITAEELRQAFRDGKVTPSEEREVMVALGKILLRLWYEKAEPAKRCPAK